MGAPTITLPVNGGSVDTWCLLYNAAITLSNNEHGTRTGDQSFADYILSRPILKDYGETAQSVSSSGGTLTIDITSGNHVYTTLTENITTITLSNPGPTGNLCFVTIEFATGAGGFTVAWPAAVKWENGATPVVTTTASRTDKFLLETRNAGSTWAGYIKGQNFTGL